MTDNHWLQFMVSVLVSWRCNTGMHTGRFKQWEHAPSQAWGPRGNLLPASPPASGGAGVLRALSCGSGSALLPVSVSSVFLGQGPWIRAHPPPACPHLNHVHLQRPCFQKRSCSEVSGGSGLTVGTLFSPEQYGRWW